MKSIKKQQGFTLIELVVVIVILGILAVTAAPRFVDLQDDARTAALGAVKASMESAATMVYSKALIQGEETSTGANTVRVNGADILVRFGYPRDNNDAALAVWTNNLLELDENEFIASRQNNGIVIVPTGITLTGSWPANIAAPEAGERNCYVQYRESDTVGEPPFILDVIPCL